MLSYQHIYHAGNQADLHKHELLARILDALTQKDKPLSYFETHSGRGVYDLTAEEALKTGEAKAGIKRTDINALHPQYRAVIEKTRAQYGPNHYPGSPLIARHILRKKDHLHLAELHKGEVVHLKNTFQHDKHAQIYQEDGYGLLNRLCPPSPRRGMVVIDPSYEVKNEYEQAARFISKLHKKWSVGVIFLWYPILKDARHRDMVDTLKAQNFPKAMCHEISFEVAAKGHGLIGSGVFVINTPWASGLLEERI